jgi:hypothetical protein
MDARLGGAEVAAFRHPRAWQRSAAAMSAFANAARVRPWLPMPGWSIAVAVIVAAAVAGPIVAATGLRGMIVLAALPAAVAIALKPQLGAYLYLVATPLIVGIARGDTLGVLRPNEALVVLIAFALAARALFIMLQGRPYRLSLDRIDLALVLMASCISILPLAFRFGRGLPISSDDLLYAVVLWKYVIVYRVFREAVTTPGQVAVCLWLSLAAAAVVAAIAIFQVTNLLGVPHFLQAYYDQPFGGEASRLITDRGTSTIASSFGVGDIMAMNLAIIILLLPDKQRMRLPLIALGGLFVLGCIASGQFSSFIGLAIIVVTVGVMTGHLHRVLALALPAAALATMALWSVIAIRLGGFERLSGLPRSWEGRLDNLERFIWPELFSGMNWLLGVRPSARVPAPEPWREWVFIESGYTWLLWSGGVPLVVAFLFFNWVSLQDLRRVAHSRHDAVRIAAVACSSWLVTMAALMMLDPHLTMRGTADLFFPLLALSFVGMAKPDLTRIEEPGRFLSLVPVARRNP